MTWILALLIGCFVLTPSASSSAEVAATYLVDGKDFKKNAVAATVLDFALYRDASCTDLLDSVPVAAQDVDLVERLKLQMVKGAAKPPKPFRLQEVLTAVPDSSTYFLRVTGSGITPIGADCQGQSISDATVTPERTGPIPAARVTNSAAIPTGGNTTLDFDTERYDVGDLHDPIGAPDVLTAPIDGVYLITGNISFGGVCTGGCFLGIFSGGTVLAAHTTTATGSSDDFSVATTARLLAGEGVRLVVNAGNDVAVQSSAEFSPEFAMTWIAP